MVEVTLGGGGVACPTTRFIAAPGLSSFPPMAVVIALIDRGYQLFTYPNISLILTNSLSLLATGVRISQDLL